MIERSESLSFVVFPVPDDVHALVAGKTIMQRSRRDAQLEWSIWDNLRLLPTFCLAPVYGEHVVGVDPTELRCALWLLLWNSAWSNLNILSSECTTVFNFLLGHLHLWLKFGCSLHGHESSSLGHLDGYSQDTFL